MATMAFDGDWEIFSTVFNVLQSQLAFLFQGLTLSDDIKSY